MCGIKLPPNPLPPAPSPHQFMLRHHGTDRVPGPLQQQGQRLDRRATDLTVVQRDHLLYEARHLRFERLQHVEVRHEELRTEALHQYAVYPLDELRVLESKKYVPIH